MKRVAVLGSTGSVGKSALAVLRHLGGKSRAVALSTNSNAGLLYQQVKLFKPKLVCVKDMAAAAFLKSKIKSRGAKIFIGEEGLAEMVRHPIIDQVVLAISGIAALSPLLEAIDNRKDVILANKEALVVAGPIIMARARLNKVRILPVDSEQSAIWQCLDNRDKSKIKNIYLTASGGPFLNTPKKDLRGVSVRQVLRHPRWKMGRKITVDSATLMNKGLEVIEAMHLFGVSLEIIKVLVHPEAIIHSMVEFVDGVTMAQLSITDMRIPLQYALTYPARLPSSVPRLDFYKIKALHFSRFHPSRFPCLGLAYRAARTLGTAPAALNAANETSVEMFLEGKIGFNHIPEIIRTVLDRHINAAHPGLAKILEADLWARDEARRVIAGLRQ